MKKILVLAISALVMVACGGNKNVGEPVQKLADLMESAAGSINFENPDSAAVAALEVEFMNIIDENAAYELTEADREYLADKIYDITISSGALNELDEASKALALSTAKSAIKTALDGYKTIGDLKDMDL